MFDNGPVKRRSQGRIWARAAVTTATAGALMAGFGAVAAPPAAQVSAGLGHARLASAQQPTLQSEVAMASSRLAANLRQPHAGTPETIAHPGSDTLGSTLGASARPRTSGQVPFTSIGSVLGTDVASFQGNVNWQAVVAAGDTFAYAKATEGTYYVDSTYFPEQYNGSYQAGMIRGAYHFAVPNNSTGAAQADFFVANGGGWSPDGKTLPGMLDLEPNPYGAECYGLTPSQMDSWVSSFDTEYHALTTRYPVLYTGASFWDTCAGGSSVASVDPLDVAVWGPDPSPLPQGWSNYTIWQYTDSNSMGYDGDSFNGNYTGLQELAVGASTPSGGVNGYWVLGNDASVFNFGSAPFYGDMRGVHLNAPIVAMAATADQGGYWQVGSDGGVFTFGDARYYGSTGGIHLNKPIVGMARTPDGKGYWLVASDGGVFTFGDAHFYGSTGGIHLNQPVVGMAPTADGRGYWLVASDGGVFTFGDAHFYGSTGGIHLNKPIVGIVPTADGKGYWLVAADGGVFTFGDAKYLGSLPGEGIHDTITSSSPTADNNGYELVSNSGKVYPFGDAPFFGNVVSLDPGYHGSIVGIANHDQ